MNSKFQAVKAVIGKDIKGIKESPQMWIPMVAVPLILLVLVPLIMILGPRLVELPSNIDQVVEMLVSNAPEGLKQKLSQFNQEQLPIYLMVNYIFGPLFLVIPLMVASIIAANGFAGEKEKGTLEGLLFAPLTGFELYLAKCLAAFIPAVLIAVGGFVVYSIVIDLLTYSLFNSLLLPNKLWLSLIFILVPVISFFGLGITVLVSAKARGFQEAQQIAGIVVVPIIALILLQLTGVIFFNSWFVLVLGIIFLGLDLILLKLGADLFIDEEVLDHFL